jgi:N-acyl-D-aspartate/D-glutamate deacylase
MTLDILIKDGLVIDGTGAPWYKAEVGVRDGKISDIDISITENAERIVDARGLVVTPGFIDIHSHSDWTFLFNPRSDSKVRQGVTTELNGLCGLSGGPIPFDRYKEFQLAASSVGFTSALIRKIDEPDWRTFGEYLAKVEKGGVPVNTGYYVGHMNLKVGVMGLEHREATDSEIREMKFLIEDAMKSGAFGLSVVLDKVSMSSSTTDEITELCKVVAKYGGSYAQHGRGRDLLEDTKEVIEIAENSGVKAILSHHAPSGELAKDDTKMIKEARARGVDILRDIIVFAYGSVGTHSILPYWVLKDGFSNAIERLINPATREKIKRDIDSNNPDLRERLKDTILLVAEKNRALEGKTWEEILRVWGQIDILDVVFDVLALNDLSVKTISFHFGARADKDIIYYLKDPFTLPESDAGSLAPYGALERIGDARGYGTFPLLLGKFVRKLNAIPLEEAVRKITSFPAQIMRLKDRGILREGMIADITILDPLQVSSKATPTQPNQYPVGIPYVIVNGDAVIDKGEYTNITPGKILRN